MTREEAKAYIIRHCNPDYPKGKTEWEQAVNMAIKALEQPQRTGKWLRVPCKFVTSKSYVYQCNKCEAASHFASEFCPHCGVKMTQYDWHTTGEMSGWIRRM